MKGGHTMADHSLPKEMDDLFEIEQRILNRLLGECVPIQEVAEEMRLSEGAIRKLSDKIWLDLSVETKQQFIRFWQQHR